MEFSIGVTSHHSSHQNPCMDSNSPARVKALTKLQKSLFTSYKPIQIKEALTYFCTINTLSPVRHVEKDLKSTHFGLRQHYQKKKATKSLKNILARKNDLL